MSGVDELAGGDPEFEVLENARLKALVADLSLDKVILQEALRGNS